MNRGFVLLLAAVLTGGVGALWAATSGFQIVTSAGARRLAVERAPLPLPEVILVDQDGHRFSLRDYRGRRVLVDFIYTRCPTVCGILGDDFGRLKVRMPDAALVSISFDPERDDRAALQRYAERYSARAPGWRIAAPAERRGLAPLLRRFDVVAIPDGFGGFEHDAAIYLVDRQNRIADVFDVDRLSPLAAAARARR